MKFSTLLLVASMAANAGLVIVLARSPQRPASPRSSEARSLETMSVEATRVASSADGSAGKALKNPSPTERAAWGRIYTDDLDELAGRLREAGFPSMAVRMIVLDAAHQKTEAARAGILGRREDVPYWKSFSYRVEDPEQRRKLAEIAIEESRVMRKNFFSAEALAEEPDMAALARRSFGALPLEKLQSLWRIEGDYDELRQEIHRPISTGIQRELTPADREKLSLLEAEKRRDIQQALTPEEFEHYELRSSPTASRLRGNLDIFQPNEAEYKALFALHREVDDRFPHRDANEENRRAHAAALDALKPQLEAALGAERYADYVQAMERGSDALNRLMVRLELPLSTVGKIETVRKDITERAAAVEKDRQLAPAERAGRLAGLAREAQEKLATTLGGARGLAAYEDAKGDWLRALRANKPAP